MPRAFITGITGQDGQHMAEFLHGKGYEIFGMVKGQNNPKGDMLRDEFPYVNIVPGDLADLPSLVKAMGRTSRFMICLLVGLVPSIAGNTFRP